MVFARVAGYVVRLLVEVHFVGELVGIVLEAFKARYLRVLLVDFLDGVFSDEILFLEDAPFSISNGNTLILSRTSTSHTWFPQAHKDQKPGSESAS